MPITIVFGKGISNLLSYKSWLPNKMIEHDGEQVPMLLTRGGGYHTLTLKDGSQYSLRGDEALNKAILENFD